MKHFLRFAIFLFSVFVSANANAQLNQFMVQSYFEEGLRTEVVPPWRSSNALTRQSYFNGLRNLGVNNMLMDNLSDWKKNWNYQEKYLMAKNAGISTIIYNDSLGSKCDEFGVFYHSSPFDINKATTLYNRLMTENNYNIIGFNFTDEPRAAKEGFNFDIIEFIPPYSQFILERNSQHLRYANLSPKLPQSTRFFREDYIQRFIDISNPNLLSFDYHPKFHAADYNGFFESLYGYGVKSVENSIPLLYVLTPFNDSNSFDSLTYRVANDSISARNMSMFNYLIYASLAYGAKGISYWPGIQWVVNYGLWDYKLKFSPGELDSLTALHNKLTNHSETLLSLNFASAYHKSNASTIGIQANKMVEELYDFNTWNNIANDNYAKAVFDDPLTCILDADLNYNQVPSEIVVTFLTNSNGKIYFWVYNKSVTKFQHVGFVPKNNVDYIDVLNDALITANPYPTFYLRPGEAKLLTSNEDDLPVNASISNCTYNGTIVNPNVQYAQDEDHFYAFESANQITLGSNVTFQSNSTKSFMANQIVLNPGVSILQGSTVRLSSYKPSNVSFVPYLRSFKPQQPSRSSETIETEPLVYPNPTHDVFNIKISTSVNDVVDVKVFNSMGHLLSVEKSNVSISLQDKPNGIYFVRFSWKNKVYCCKVVKI